MLFRSETAYVAFVLEIPQNFRGVADVQVLDGEILVIERGTSQRFSLKSEKKW